MLNAPKNIKLLLAEQRRAAVTTPEEEVVTSSPRAATPPKRLQQAVASDARSLGALLDKLLPMLDSTTPHPTTLSEAPCVVAAGFGVGSKENFARIEHLAELLGAEIGGTRPAVDAGFIPHERMIGQTGLSIAPRLYLAFGISGQVLHTIGIERAACIVAINNDPEAAIFRIADYTIVGDVREVTEKLITHLTARKNG